MSASPSPTDRGRASNCAAPKPRWREDPSEANGMRVAKAVTTWGDVGGYDLEIVWDAACLASIRQPYADGRGRAR